MEWLSETLLFKIMIDTYESVIEIKNFLNIVDGNKYETCTTHLFVSVACMIDHAT